MTPWAELLLAPVGATDEVVRRRFHQLARLEHPDRDGAQGLPGPRWSAVTTAYAAIKTVEARAAWELVRSRAARLCSTCGGLGVQVKRFGAGKGITMCPVCMGAGRQT
jgi:DnaJ-class molecular chaperone